MDEFFDYDQRVDWIITNPPFSQLRAFLKHSYEIANNVVFLTFTAHVLGMKARLQDMNAPNGPLKSCCVYQHHPNLGRSQGFRCVRLI
jgi:hypothetical protein